MSDIAIRVESLSKRYRRGLPSGDDRLTEVVSNIGRGLLQAAGRLWRQPQQKPVAVVPERSGEFWALRDVSFEVKHGQVIGIIGRNGAGKSTLLKILSRITEPTSGRFGLAGRVGSLLEVGTGFHPDLTGRENVFLNGTFLGMSRREIARKFDTIAAFAEIDPFLDTPVKWYSSGMQVRLGFSVAAHLEPEILIVDEALAVGDAPFQQKCIRKVQEVSRRDGCTVLFVSHSLEAIRQFCRRAFWLDRGELRLEGETAEVTALYEQDCGVPTHPPAEAAGVPAEESSPLLGPALEARPAPFPLMTSFTPDSAGHFVVRSGLWRAGPAGLQVCADREDAAASLLVADPLPPDLDLRVVLSPQQANPGERCHVLVLVDYVRPGLFAFVGAALDTGRWVMGRCEEGGWDEKEIGRAPIALGQDHELRIALRGRSVTLRLGDSQQLRQELPTRARGTVGLAARNATVLFKYFSIQAGGVAGY